MANYRHGGYDKNKYIIKKTNGNPINPHAEYFVMNIAKDPHALVALRAYAESVATDNLELARDLKNVLKDYNLD